MPPLNFDENKRVLKFATELSLFAAQRAPNAFVESKVQKVVHILQKQYGHSRDLKKAHILAFIKNNSGSASQAELVEHFDWTQPLVSTMLGELETEGKIEAFKQEGAGSGTLAGRPKTRYRLKTG